MIDARGTDVIFRLFGRTISIAKSQIKKRGNETLQEAANRIAASLAGSDRTVIIEILSEDPLNCSFFQGKIGAVPLDFPEQPRF